MFVHSSVATREASLLSYVCALIQFAESRADFANSLATAIQDYDWQIGVIEVSPVSPYLEPQTESHAERMALWLIAEAKQSPQLQTTLATWASNREIPKDAIIGIIGIAIMGPTLGILDQPKKKKRSMLQLVIDESAYDKLTKHELAELTTAVAQTLVARELELAKGNVYRLHPDSAEWCLSEPVTKLYTESREKIAELAKMAQTEKLSHVVHNNDGQPLVLALSPSVNDSFIEDSGAKLAD